MGWESVNRLEHVVKLNAGEELSGDYVGSFEHTDKKDDVLTVYEIKNADGVHQLIGCGSLNRLMSKIVIGSRIKVTYKGMGECENPRQPGQTTSFHDYKVEVWVA